MEFKITHSQILKDIPSASGIVNIADKYYVVGDDSPFLFCLDPQLQLLSKTKIFSAEHVKGDRITKKHKPDFEAMEQINEQEIAILGSGSKSPARDYFVRVLLKDEMEVETYSISDFYAHLKTLDIFSDTELNIEAAAVHKEKLFLLNRRKNLVISFSYKEFLNHVIHKDSLPEVKITEVQLPEVKGIEAGFSGATALQEKPVLIFTASVEDTDNAYDDGEVLGSFIGLLDIGSGELIGELYPIESPDETHGPLKVESVAIEKVISDKEFRLLLTTDSDGGDSLLLRAELRL